MIPRQSTAAIIGATGGIGAAFVRACRAGGFAHVAGFARAGGEHGPVDVTSEPSIIAAAEALDGLPSLRLVVVASGMLHGESVRPERSYRALDPDALATLFRVNTIGPALVAKHFLPRLAGNGHAVFAVLSARVGSISDNRLGGWHGYRASKAALNMIIRNLAIEIARNRPEQVCVGLHPGTVATPLSAPFARGPAMTADDSAEHLLAVLDAVGPGRSGSCLAYDGSEVPP